jgi:hypothetical protein
MIPDLTLSEALAYNHKALSSEAFRQFLSDLQTARSSIMSRQLMEETAEQLQAVGLLTIASEIMQFGATLPHRWELPHRYRTFRVTPLRALQLKPS